MARGRADLWDAEIARAADIAEIPAEKLASFFQGERAGAAPAPWNEVEILKMLGRLLVLAAEELESAAADVRSLGPARGGLLGLAHTAALLEVPRLKDWAVRLAESSELSELATDAARMLRGEAFEMVLTQSLVELRECSWRWPEWRVVKTQAESEPEPVPELAVVPVAVAEPEPELEPEPEPEPVEPEPAPAPPVMAPRRRMQRALVCDPSAIAAGFLARLLMSRGLAVTMAETPERAAIEMAHGGYDVAFAIAEWDLPAGGKTLVVKLVPEGSNAPAGLGERILFKPPAAEEVSQILDAWTGAPMPPT